MKPFDDFSIGKFLSKLKSMLVPTNELSPEGQNMERRVLAKVQLLVISVTVFLLFLLYALHLKVRMIEGFLQSAMESDVRILQKINDVEKSVRELESRPDSILTHKHLGDNDCPR